MAFVTTLALYASGKKSSPGLPLVFERDNLTRCGSCLLAVHYDSKENRIECSGCHRWREVIIKRKEG